MTLQDLSKLCFRQFGKEIGWCPDAPQLSRWETEKAVPLLKHRPALLAIAKTLGMDDSEKNEFLIKAGLSPLQPEELDVDAMLSKLGSERWRKTHFLSKSLGWSEDKVGKKLGIPFWDVRHDLKEAEKELSLLKEKKTWLSQQQVQHIKSLQEFAKSVIESCPIFYPSFDTPKEIRLFHDAYFSLWKLFHDLVHHAYWPSLAAHLSDGGQKIEHMAAEITIESTCMP